MELLTVQVNQLIKKTMEDPRLNKEKEMDPWTQPSQPLSESNYFDNDGITVMEKEIKEIGTQTEKSPDFFPTEKSIAKRKKVRHTATRITYSPTRVKSRNFLSNTGYNSINKADFYNENFILDVFILLVKNLNPFSLQRKISDKFNTCCGENVFQPLFIDLSAEKGISDI